MTEQETRTIVNCATGETSIVPLTIEELAERDEMAAQAEEERIALEAEIATKTALKESAKAKLVAGQPLTAEEASVLVI